MKPIPLGRLGGRRRLMIAVLLLLVGLESFVLYQQNVVDRSRRMQSEKLLQTFLAGDTAEATMDRNGVRIRLENVRFKWSDRVYIDTRNMALRAVPVRGSTVDFDDLDSFHMVLQRSTVSVGPRVLGGMFNESVFNYPDSRIRDLEVAIDHHDPDGPLVVLKGKIKVLAWIPFEMYSRLGVDRRSNTMTIAVDHLKAFGGIPVTKLLKWKPMELEQLIALPPNRHLLVEGNRIMVKPFGLFPPPRINGRLAGVTVEGNAIHIAFAGEPIPAPESAAKNYVYLRGGTAQFGHFRMLDTNVLIVDANQSTPFAFSLVHYADLIPRSRIEVPNTGAARVVMPDYGS